jgi:hypothetical protein
MTISFKLFKKLEKLNRKPLSKNETYLSEKGEEEVLDQTGRISKSPKKYEILHDRANQSKPAGNTC